MPTILDEIRPHLRPSAIAPKIREVCLVGVAPRHYRHVALPEGLGAQGSGPSRQHCSGSGVRKSGTG
jgi:hypothetical protein